MGSQKRGKKVSKHAERKAEQAAQHVPAGDDAPILSVGGAHSSAFFLS